MGHCVSTAATDATTAVSIAAAAAAAAVLLASLRRLRRRLCCCCSCHYAYGRIAHLPRRVESRLVRIGQSAPPPARRTQPFVGGEARRDECCRREGCRAAQGHRHAKHGQAALRRAQVLRQSKRSWASEGACIGSDGATLGLDERLELGCRRRSRCRGLVAPCPRCSMG